LIDVRNDLVLQKPFIKTMNLFTRKLMSISLFRQKLCSIACFVLILNCAENVSAQSFSSVETFLGSSDEAAQAVKTLAFDAQTTAYQNPDGLKVFGDGAAKVLDVDASSLASVNFSDTRLADVQLIRIRISDAQEVSNPVSLEAVSALNQLQTILIVCTADLSAEQIAQSFSGAGTQLRVLYSLSSPK
jgi:hypothetical protein